MLDETKQKLVEDNIRLVYHIANKHNCKDEDTLQYGLYGLCKAADLYDPNRGVKFSTFAYNYIINWMKGTYSDIKERQNTKEYLETSIDLSYIILEDNSAREEYLRIYSCASHKMQKVLDLLYRGYTQQEIAKEFNVSKSSVCRWISKFKEEINNERNQTRKR